MTHPFHFRVKFLKRDVRRLTKAVVHLVFLFCGGRGAKWSGPPGAREAQIRRRKCEDFAPRNEGIRDSGEGGSKEERPPGARGAQIRRRKCEDFAPRSESIRASGERGAKRGGHRAPMLASTSPQSLLPPSRHANMVRIIPAAGRLCWRRLPRKAFYLRRGTPTWSEFSRPAGAYVGVDLPAKPFTSVETRQHGQDYPGRRAPEKAKIEKIQTCH